MIKLIDTFRDGANVPKINIFQILWFLDRASLYYGEKKKQLDAQIISLFTSSTSTCFG
jgi:hypothetical protein